MLVFLYSIPISLFHLPGYLIWSRFKNQKYGLFLFPVIMIIMEWIQYTFTPLASWGVAAYTMHDNVSLIQTLSLFGLAGLSFLIYWVNVSIANIIIKRKISISTFQVPLIMMFFLIVFGSIRYDMSKANGIDGYHGSICASDFGSYCASDFGSNCAIVANRKRMSFGSICAIGLD